MSRPDHKKPGPDADPGDVPSGGRYGPRGGRHVSQERRREQLGTSNDDPGPLWDDVIRAIEDACTPLD